MTIEKNISNLIRTQFPSFYNEEGDTFVEFVTQYYKWMEESNNVIYHSRRLSDYRDIDETVDAYVSNIKEKYLKNIQLDTSFQTRQLVKHSSDLYKSKGTDVGIDLFFKALFGASAEVYYPSSDIFKLSDGKWVEPKYLEVSFSTITKDFVGKQIEGVNSGATAFVERYIRRKIRSKYINVLYISTINGNFEFDEPITLSGQKLKNIPKVIGSLTTIDIVAGSTGFVIGDIVTIESDNGTQGKGRVTGVSNITGVVGFELTDGGWGYTANAKVLISEKVLSLSNVSYTYNANNENIFKVFETITQPAANVKFVNANAAISLQSGDLLYTYYSNNSVAGIGKVMENSANILATNGEVYVAEISGNLQPVIEPSANITGNVAITKLNSVITGFGNTVSGNSTIFANTTGLYSGQYLSLSYYTSNNDLQGSDTVIVNNVVNSTSFVIKTSALFDSNKVRIVSLGNKTIIGNGTNFVSNFVYGDKVALYSNSSAYTIATVNTVINSTYMTVQSSFNFSNSSTKAAKVTTNNKIYTSGNTVVANILSCEDKRSYANVIGMSSNQILFTTNTDGGSFSNSEVVFQVDSDGNEVANGVVYLITAKTGANTTYSITNVKGMFVPNNAAYTMKSRYIANGVMTAKTAKLSSLSFNVGVVGVNNAFVFSNNNIVFGNTYGASATIDRISLGTAANFAISNNLGYVETVNFNPELVTSYLNIPLNSPTYGFPAAPSANLTTNTLIQIFPTKSYTLGSILSLTNINPGAKYDIAPFVLVYEKQIADQSKHNFIAEIKDATGQFKVGEILTQNNGATGIVQFANTTSVNIKRISYNNIFQVGNLIYGKSTNFNANLVYISETVISKPIGINAIVSSNVQSGNGSVTSMVVFDSGFGYVDKEVASFTKSDGSVSGSARLNLAKQGKSEGFYENRKGQLSDTKFLFDGDYYQEHSYEIRTAIRSDKYIEMLKTVMHVAGTKMFSATVIDDVFDSTQYVETEILKE